jgi:hypothetical protein
VCRTLKRVPTVLGEGAGTLVEAEPKTKQSRRSMVLPAFALEALQRQKQLPTEWKHYAEDAWEEHDYMFTTPLGRYIHPHTLYRRFKVLLKQAGLPDLRFHDLHHSVVSSLLSHGVHPKVVQEILGHSQMSITLDIYSHVLPTMYVDAMEKLHRAFLCYPNPDISEQKDDYNDEDAAAGIFATVQTVAVRPPFPQKRTGPAQLLDLHEAIDEEWNRPRCGGPSRASPCARQCPSHGTRCVFGQRLHQGCSQRAHPGVVSVGTATDFSARHAPLG